MRIVYCGAEAQYEACVSDDDYEYITQWKWNCFITLSGLIYARRKDNTTKGKGRTVLMHVAVLEHRNIIRPTRAHTVDHADRDTLNNQDFNLRWATKLEQRLNQHCMTTREAINYATQKDTFDYSDIGF